MGPFGFVTRLSDPTECPAWKPVEMVPAGFFGLPRLLKDPERARLRWTT